LRLGGPSILIDSHPGVVVGGSGWIKPALDVDNAELQQRVRGRTREITRRSNKTRMAERRLDDSIKQLNKACSET